MAIIKQYVKQFLLKSSALLTLAASLHNLPSVIMIKGRRNNKVVIKGAFLKNTRVRFFGKGNRMIISPGTLLINCTIQITGDNCKLEIANRCNLANSEFWIEDDGGIIRIGNHTTIEGGHFAATEGQSISIGNDCMFSHGIEIRNGDSHAIFDNLNNQRINHAKSVIIGNHVWLGADVKVLKGAVIDDGCVIATGTIHTGSADADCIYAGIPSKKVRDNIIWSRNR